MSAKGVQKGDASGGVSVDPVNVGAFDVLRGVVIGSLVHVVYGLVELFSAEKPLLSPANKLEGVHLEVHSSFVN
eukprot:7325113-Heterocapsa_arctica.AAC.1